MKIKTILIAAMLVVSGFTQAQVSKESFEKGVNFVNCKTVELSLQNDTNYQRFIQRCPCGNGVGYNQVKDFLTSVHAPDKTIAVSTEVESLKNSFKENLKQEDALKFLSETIFSDKVKYQKLFSFADRRKADKGFGKFKEDLKKDLPTILASQAQANTAALNSESEATPPTLEDKVNIILEQKLRSLESDKNWFTRNITYFVIISLVLLLVVIIIILKGALSGSEPEDEVPNKIKNYVNDKISKALIGNAGGLGVNSNDVRTLREEIERLKGEIRQLNYKIDSAKIPLEIVQPKYEQQSWQDNKQTEVKSPVETFYLSNPNSDGSFNDSSASPTYREGASIYKFTKIGGNKAKFQIDERESSVKLALMYPDKSIDPVCDGSNAYEAKAKRIVTETPGEAELVGDKWIKNTKAKIRYES